MFSWPGLAMSLRKITVFYKNVVEAHSVAYIN